MSSTRARGPGHPRARMKAPGEDVPRAAARLFFFADRLGWGPGETLSPGARREKHAFVFRSDRTGRDRRDVRGCGLTAGEHGSGRIRTPRTARTHRLRPARLRRRSGTARATARNERSTHMLTGLTDFPKRRPTATPRRGGVHAPVRSATATADAYAVAADAPGSARTPRYLFASRCGYRGHGAWRAPAICAGPRRAPVRLRQMSTPDPTARARRADRRPTETGNSAIRGTADVAATAPPSRSRTHAPATYSGKRGPTPSARTGA
jgi:hypothetical protein